MKGYLSGCFHFRASQYFYFPKSIRSESTYVIEENCVCRIHIYTDVVCHSTFEVLLLWSLIHYVL